MNKSQKGFTIIEVLIVLAIAALILLIVFLAVPALQRNARNTSKREDVGRVLAALNEFIADNSNIPAACAVANNMLTIQGNINTSANLSYYTANSNCGFGTPTVDSVALYTLNNSPADPNFHTASQDYLEIFEYGTCNGNALALGSIRQFAAIYEIENGSSSWVEVCAST